MLSIASSAGDKRRIAVSREPRADSRQPRADSRERQFPPRAACRGITLIHSPSPYAPRAGGPVRSVVILAIALAVAAPRNVAAQAQAGPPANTLHTLLAEHLEWRLREFPESATRRGDSRYNARLTDLSPEAMERRKRDTRRFLDRARAIDGSTLGGQDVLTHTLFVATLERDIEGDRFPAEVLPVDQINGPQLAFDNLIEVTRFRTRGDYDDYLARLAAVPRYFDQVTALLQRGISIGWVQPAVPLRGVPDQIEAQITNDPAKSLFYAPFNRIPSTIPEADRERIRSAGRTAIANGIMPALTRFRDFIRDVYLPAGRLRPIGISALPNGASYYRYAIRQYTTTSLTADSIHRLGLAEVARIRVKMDSVMRRTGFTGSFPEFLTFLRTDPRFYYTKAEDLVAGYRDIAKRADAGLPTLFAELPRNTYGVRAFPDFEAPSQTTARYYRGAADGTRPGYYMVNTYRLDMRPKYEMEALTLHEAVPGHHLQIARALELRELPDFRRNAPFTAFTEGWGLYAESLGEEMGFYTDPYSKFGQLTYEMWRACRLVVDTGMHQFGWSRERAIDFMKQNTAKSEQDIVVEIDRYIVWPGRWRTSSGSSRSRSYARGHSESSATASTSASSTTRCSTTVRFHSISSTARSTAGSLRRRREPDRHGQS